MNDSSINLDVLNSWKITFNCNNPLSTLKILGNGLFQKKLESSKTIFLEKEKNKSLIKIHNDFVELYTFPAIFSVYYRINKNIIMISNVASELIHFDEEIKINNSVLIQNLCGTSYPNDDLFLDIKLCDSSSIYKFMSNGNVVFNSTLKYYPNTSLNDVYKELNKNLNESFNSKNPIILLISAGFDSRLNLSIAIDLQKKYGFKIFLFHEYKNEREYKIVKKIVDEVGLKFECFKRDDIDYTSREIIFNKKFILYCSGIYRDNIPRWISHLNYFKSKFPNAIIFGLGVEAHKGKYYRKILKNDDFKIVFGNNNSRFKLISRYLNIENTNKSENIFFNRLVSISNIFPNLDSRIDFLHYHTYCSNGYKNRCDIFSKLFNIPFPFIDDKFLSMVFSLKKEEKIDFVIVKNLISKLNPILDKIEYYSGNEKSLDKKKLNLKSLFLNNFTRYFIYAFKNPKRKGSDLLSEDFINKIKNDRPKSHITKTLHKFLIKEKFIPVIRVVYAFQLYNYFKLLEEEKNVIIKCF